MSRTDHQKRFSLAIATGESATLYFGRLASRKLNAINVIRRKNHLQPIKSGELYIYRGVLEKLCLKRVRAGRLHPTDVADIAYSAIYNRSALVLPSRFPQIQVLVRVRADGKTANVVYIGEFRGACSIKSVYINDIKDVLKQAKR